MNIYNVKSKSKVDGEISSYDAEDELSNDSESSQQSEISKMSKENYMSSSQISLMYDKEDFVKYGPNDALYLLDNSTILYFKRGRGKNKNSSTIKDRSAKKRSLEDCIGRLYRLKNFKGTMASTCGTSHPIVENPNSARGKVSSRDVKYKPCPTCLSTRNNSHKKEEFVNYGSRDVLYLVDKRTTIYIKRGRRNNRSILAASDRSIKEQKLKDSLDNLHRIKGFQYAAPTENYNKYSSFIMSLQNEKEIVRPRSIEVDSLQSDKENQTNFKKYNLRVNTRRDNDYRQLARKYKSRTPYTVRQSQDKTSPKKKLNVKRELTYPAADGSSPMKKIKRVDEKLKSVSSPRKAERRTSFYGRILKEGMWNLNDITLKSRRGGVLTETHNLKTEKQNPRTTMERRDRPKIRLKTFYTMLDMMDEI